MWCGCFKHGTTLVLGTPGLEAGHVSCAAQSCAVGGGASLWGEARDSTTLHGSRCCGGRGESLTWTFVRRRGVESLNFTCGTTLPVAHTRLGGVRACITQLKAQGPSRTCNESKEEEEEGEGLENFEEGSTKLSRK